MGSMTSLFDPPSPTGGRASTILAADDGGNEPLHINIPSARPWELLPDGAVLDSGSDMYRWELPDGGQAWIDRKQWNGMSLPEREQLHEDLRSPINDNFLQSWMRSAQGFIFRPNPGVAPAYGGGAGG